jgi:hypothetical protein
MFNHLILDEMKKYLVLFVALFTLVSCSKDDDDEITVNQASVELYSKDFHQITTNQANPTYSSENEYVAKVSTSGMITAKHIGSTFIDINGTRKVEVTVKPKYDLYEPLHDFNMTKSEVIAKRGTPTDIDDTLIIYKNPHVNINFELYSFKKSTGKLSYSSVIYPFEGYVTNNYALAERYEPFTYDSSLYTFFFIDTLDYNTSRLVVTSHIYNSNYCVNLYSERASVNLSKTKKASYL